MNRVPAIPASIAALVLLGGLALIYWSLTGLGLLKSTAAGAPSSNTGGDTLPQAHVGGG